MYPIARAQTAISASLDFFMTFAIMMKLFEYRNALNTRKILNVLIILVLYIVGHDEYQMRGRKTISREEEIRRGSYFYTLINIYGLEGEKA